MRIKKISAVVLAVVIAFCQSITAFSAKSIEEYLGDEYTYAGEIIDGRNIVSEKVVYDDIYVYYSFESETDGYCGISYGDEGTSMSVYIIRTTDGNKISPDEEWIWDDFTFESIYYLEKGEYYIVADVYSADAFTSFGFEYLGESITGISFGYAMIDGYEFDYYSDGSFDAYADAIITFSSGKTFEYRGGRLSGEMVNDFKEGNNEVLIEFMDKKYPSTATVYPVSHYISDVELSNAEYYMENSVEYYYDIDAVYPYGETVTVTFTDGTTLTEEFNGMMYITLPNGQEYELNIDFYWLLMESSERCCMEICLEHITVKAYRFSGKKASFTENLDKLADSISELFQILCEEMDYVFEYGESDDKLEAFIAYPSMIFINVIAHFVLFCNYYVTLSFIR